jgi:hypothetical protein
MVMPRMPFSAPSGPVPGMGSPSAPSPMQVPPPPVMEMPMPSPSQPDLMALLDKLVNTPAQPKYPPGYKKPKRPVVSEILKNADNAKQANQSFLDQVADTYRRVRYQTAGYLTETDRLARELGQQTPYISSALLDDWNRFTAYLASRPIAYSVDVWDPEKAADAQKIEDFAYYLRQKNERNWVERGNMSLTQSEAKDLTLFGVLVARRTLDLTNTHCPIDAVLVDPASVFPVWGRAGAFKTLEAVYRVVRMPAKQVLADYYSDEPPKAVIDALSSSLKSFDESADVDVVEYWDTWWRGVFIQGTDVAIIPLTEHKYGCVPYVIQYGPGGEPTHTRSPEESYNEYRSEETGWGAERVHKAVSYLQPKKLPHDQREGLSAKMMEATLRDFEPPMTVESTAKNADGYDFPEVDLRPGATNHMAAGEERATPTLAGAPAMSQTAGLLMNIIGQDASTNLLSEGFSNTADKSNISGTARSNMAEQGREQQAGWVEALELFRGRCASLDVKLWRNFGHLARYGTGKKQPFYVPRRNPQEGEGRSYELTPDVIDSVDCDVICTMAGLSMSELIPFGQAAQLYGPDGLGVWDINLIARKAGVTDIERIQQNNRTYRNIRKAEELPEFAKLITVPQAMIQALKEARGNEELTAALTEQLMIWMQMVAQPQQAQIGMSMQPQPQPGAAPPGTEPIGGIPGGTNTAAAMGQLPGPGSGPQGPVGNPSPPPPGSIRVA